MTSRERVREAINHRAPDKIPNGFGATSETGIQPWIYRELLEKLGLKEREIYIYEVLQMLAKVDEDVRQVLQVDLVGLRTPTTMFGYPNKEYKPFVLPGSLEVQVPMDFNTEANADGSIYQYPRGDKSYAPSGKFPKDGFYNDVIEGTNSKDKYEISPSEWVDETFPLLEEDTLEYLQQKSKELYEQTEYAVIGESVFGGLGGIIMVQGPHIPNRKGIRTISDWFIALAENPEYMRDLHDVQIERGIENLKLYREAVDDRIDIIRLSGTDFGGQQGLLFSKEMYQEIFKPYHKKIIDWVHENTPWKTYFHSCGSINELLPDFIDIGLDIINPIQLSAANMDLKGLMDKFASRITFFGGGVNTQKTLANGNPEVVRKEVIDHLELFKGKGGFVFCPDHNIQAKTPVENVLELFTTFNKHR